MQAEASLNMYQSVQHAHTAVPALVPSVNLGGKLSSRACTTFIDQHQRYMTSTVANQYHDVKVQAVSNFGRSFLLVMSHE